MHDRFKIKVWAFKKDFTGSLAKWLVKQSPYVVPENLSECIVEFDRKIADVIKFDGDEMAEIDLSDLVAKIEPLLWDIPQIANLNKAKDSTTPDIIFTSRYEGKPKNPDRDFIDITAVAQNIVCDFAEREESEKLLEHQRDSGGLYEEQSQKRN